MTTSYEKAVEHMGATKGMQNHDHDLVHELSRRLDSLWRYDQYISNAEGIDEIQEFWRKAKAQEQKNVKTLKQLIKKHIEAECF